MKYYLSSKTIERIKVNNITQQALADEIEKLQNAQKVNSTISQQSISRYMNGASFPNDETGKIISKAVTSLLKTSKFRKQRKQYLEKMKTS